MADKPFLYYDRLKLWDIIIITIYLIFSISVFIIYRYGSNEFVLSVALAHIVCSQIFSFIFLYRLLRNFSFYLIWFGFAILHAVMYFLLIGNRQFEAEDVKPFPVFLNTIVLLLIFQVLRYFSLKIQKREFEFPASRAPYKMPGEIESSAIDGLVLIIYFVSLFVLFRIDRLL
ncbi:MAG: hypothetical protein JST50_01330 [Bacteroidetes bacterium]|jgi:magnesium-transporting ATPase (P-type)|nr:hypothetical protein [Bacteroidota bacterium]